MSDKAEQRPRATALAYTDEVLDTRDLPGGRLKVLRGIGSGLARRPGDAPGTFWAIGDRGPNLKVKLAIERYGLTHLAEHGEIDGAKVMSHPAIGPAVSELHLDGDGVALVRTLPLRDRAGRPLSGLPTPGGDANLVEPAIGLDGARLAPDPAGADTEGLAVAADGGFWIGDEYGPSLLRVAADGMVTVRWVPRGSEHLFAGADYPVVGALPPIAARRRLNRGFEALALSADERWLYLAFQSPLAHPDEPSHKRARHVRLWQLDATTGAVAAQFVYPLDDPAAFRRDGEKGRVRASDLKVSEMAVLAPGRLLILERASATTKLYVVHLDPARALAPEHLDVATRPTLEESSACGDIDVALVKTLVLDTDDLPYIDADLEGMIVLDARTLLLVNDNDFGVEDVRTRFWRVTLPVDLPHA